MAGKLNGATGSFSSPKGTGASRKGIDSRKGSVSSHSAGLKKVKKLNSLPISREIDPKQQSEETCIANGGTEDAMYTPRTLSVLIVLLAVFLFMVRYCHYLDMDVVSSVKLGLAASGVSFIAFGATHLPDSMLLRPHPSFWRAVLAVGVLYLALLSFLLFQSLDTIRAILLLHDPSLKSLPEERQYAEDCRIFTSDDPFLFVRTTFDIFIVAHTLGYFAKTIIVRDWRASTCISVVFEIVEVTFQHALPNFKECWWDHLLLDVLICNGGGTLLGILALRIFHARRYNWVLSDNVKSKCGKARRFISQLVPQSLVPYEWNVFLSPKRFVQFLLLLSLMTLQELNTFTVKHILHIPPKHHLVVLRLVMWLFLAIPAVCEYYFYISGLDPTNKLGPSVWVSVVNLLFEVVLAGKLAVEGNYFQEPMPGYIAIPWITSLISLCIWFAIFFGVLTLKQRMEKRCLLYAISSVFFYFGCGCVLAMFAMGMPDLQIGREAFQRYVYPYERYIIFWR